jgi:UDP-N-acetylmuramate dehydrogenase
MDLKMNAKVNHYILNEFLSENFTNFKINIKLSEFTYLKTGGFVDYIISPKNIPELTKCIKFLYLHEIKYKIVGYTSNLMFLDNVDYSIIIETSKINDLVYDNKENLISAECGVFMPELSRFALSKSISGFEGFEGIPGSVGAAVLMNAGAYGNEIKDTLASVEVITKSGKLKTYLVSELKFSNRNSIFRSNSNHEIIIRAKFNIKFSKTIDIYKKMALFHNKRHKYQEFMYPTLGSIYSGSIYRALAKKDPIFRIISSLYYLIYYKWKLLGREAPDDRKWLNDLTHKRFGITFKNQPFSNKDMNTLINNGHHSSELVDYINQLDKLIGQEIELENEIVQKF